MQPEKKKSLGITASNIRLSILKEVYSAKSGHPGGSLSLADIMAYLYFEKMNIDPKNPDMEDRDRFVLSKGHACPVLYATLAEAGYFSKDHLALFRNIDGMLQGHPCINIPGVDMSSGSLGQGISAACGMALSGKVFGKSYRVYCAIGDGECEEGQVWEASMFANHHALDNLCVILDLNNLQIDGPVKNVMSIYPIEDKFKAFGYNVISIDAHDFDQIEAAFDNAEKCKGRPTLIIANSIKGKGVSFMEGDYTWHGKAPSDEQYETAVCELNEYIKSLGGNE